MLQRIGSIRPVPPFSTKALSPSLSRSILVGTLAGIVFTVAKSKS